LSPRLFPLSYNLADDFGETYFAVVLVFFGFIGIFSALVLPVARVFGEIAVFFRGVAGRYDLVLFNGYAVIFERSFYRVRALGQKFVSFRVLRDNLYRYRLALRDQLNRDFAETFGF